MLVASVLRSSKDTKKINESEEAISFCLCWDKQKKSLIRKEDWVNLATCFCLFSHLQKMVAQFSSGYPGQREKKEGRTTMSSIRSLHGRWSAVMMVYGAATIMTETMTFTHTRELLKHIQFSRLLYWSTHGTERNIAQVVSDTKEARCHQRKLREGRRISMVENVSRKGKIT